ncbi:hypothetical protein H632_c2804p0 [Helicosporidium sp. ATCC 50920]|nr:hypothetical protein H632_c2804p0 [Helicosporidium sp. ATCC 50920]|eukprot:KDD72860.1 hypothetical protein H632_c2804p0 [Helicosporidium sp. ATCC 50920]
MQSLDALYSLFAEVVTTFAEYGHLSWSEVGPRLEEMTTRSSTFHAAAARLPKTLREWPAYLECRRTVDDFQDALPLIQGFVHASIQRRHWAQLVDCVQPAAPLPAPGAGLTLRQFLDAGPLLHRDEVLDICAAALKEEQMQLKFDALVAQWTSEAFDFVAHKQRGAVVLHVRFNAGSVQGHARARGCWQTHALVVHSRDAASRNV